MNKMLSGMQGLPPGFPPLPVLPPQSYYPPARCIQHHIKVTLLFSRDSRHPDTDSRPRKARCHSPDSNSSHTLIHPGTTANPSVTSAEASAPGHIPARSGAVSAAMPGASALRADSDDTKTGLTRPVSFLIHRV